jgi:hypothetical protein
MGKIQEIAMPTAPDMEEMFEALILASLPIRVLNGQLSVSLYQPAGVGHLFRACPRRTDQSEY